MSYNDTEGDAFMPDAPSHSAQPVASLEQMAADLDAEEEEEEEEEERGPPPKRSLYDEDDDDDSEEEEEEETSGRKRKRQRRRKNDASKFLDVMAEVSDDDDDEDEGAEGAIDDGFVDTAGDDDNDAQDTRRRNTQLDNRRRIESERSAEEIAEALKGRYAGQAPVRYTGDMNEVPQRLLMPSVHDASLWQVRVKPGREREIVFSLIRKAIDMEFGTRPLNILAAFQRDSLPGMIYVEARNSQQVSTACQGLIGVYVSRGIHLVPIDEMASLLMIKKIEQTLQTGSWVRIRRGRYGGDLAQVLDIDDTGENVGLKFVPRIDLTPRDDEEIKKRKKPLVPGATNRPPQRLFNYDEVYKIWGKKNIAKRNHAYLFQSDTYKDGFIEKDFKSSALVVDDVQPTLDEITMFSSQTEGADEVSGVNLSAIAEASKKAAVAVLQPGDHIEVFEGEQAGVYGVVDEISQDVVTFIASGSDLEGQKIEVPARSVRKRFKAGDHVKVMSGQNVNETGLVVAVSSNIVTFVSDMTMQEVSVFSKDLREAAEVGSSTNIIGNYELHDLVQLDAQTVGVIYKTERDSFRVLDQNGSVRLVQPQQISMRRDSRRAIANDAQGHEIRPGDDLKESEGEGRRGHVLHIFQAMHVFLYNRDIALNGGVFVANARSLVPVAPKSVKSAASDLSKMNPGAMPANATGGMVGSGMMRGPRDRSVGCLVMVVKGLNKGLVGTIKDTNGNIARVELHTSTQKVISIDKKNLRRRMPDGTLHNLDAPAGRGPPGPGSNPFGGTTANPYTNGGSTPIQNNGSRTPAWSMGQTPNPYGSNNSSRTPAWNTGSKTPNPYAGGDGGKTPAWNASSRTPNPYAGAAGRTPNPYGGASSYGGGGAGGWGSSNTDTDGWKSPGKPTNSSGGWGGAADSGGASGGWGGAPSSTNDWNETGFYGSAPTPAVAATPAVSAPTPWSMSAPTPAASAPTPYSVPTPYSAPTPGRMDDDADDSDNWEASDTWVYDLPENVQKQVLVRIEHPRDLDPIYLDNNYAGTQGQVASAYLSRVELDQTITVRFEERKGADNDTTVGRSINTKYVRPVLVTENTPVDQRVVVLNGPSKHRVMVVRENENDPDVKTANVSSVEDWTVQSIPRNWMVCLA